jgi:general secretion pathway protein K
LLQNMGFMVNESRVSVIVDWLDKGDELISPAGAEQSDYSGFNPPRFPANTDIADTAELAAMAGYSLAEVQRLMPFISALPGPTTININSAPEPVLMALSGDLGIDFVDMVVDNRPFLTLQEFYQAIDIRLMVGEPALAIRWPAKLIDVKSDFFQLNLEVTLGQSRLEVKSIMHRGANGRPAVIRREITVVPAGVTTVPSRASDSDEENADDLSGSGRDRFRDQDEYDREYYLRPICEIADSYTTGDLNGSAEQF